MVSSSSSSWLAAAPEIEILKVLTFASAAPLIYANKCEYTFKCEHHSDTSQSGFRLKKKTKQKGQNEINKILIG